MLIILSSLAVPSLPTRDGKTVSLPQRNTPPGCSQPTYKGWKGSCSPPPRPPRTGFPAYLQGMETWNTWYNPGRGAWSSQPTYKGWKLHFEKGKGGCLLRSQPIKNERTNCRCKVQPTSRYKATAGGLSLMLCFQRTWCWTRFAYKSAVTIRRFRK